MKRENRLRGVASLFGGFFFAPFGFLLSLQANYLLVDRACAYNWMSLLYVVCGASVVITGGGMLLALRHWMNAGQQWPAEGFGVIPRNRFIAAIAVLMSGLFLVVVIAQIIPVFILSPCQR